MVRTLADGGSKKATGSKATRKQLSCGGGGSSSNVYSGSPSPNNPNFGYVNHARMWPTPSWQKGINSFFKKSDKTPEEGSSSTTEYSSQPCERMESDDVTVVTSEGSSSGDGACSSSNNDRIYSDEEDKENIDPSSSPERFAPKMNGERSEDGCDSPSPKQRRKPSGKQKAGPCKKKKRMVLQEDSDYDE